MGSYNWNWPILLKEPYFTWIVTGFGKTILIAVLAWAIAFPLGSAIGIARTADNRALRFAGTVYVDIFRNIPLLVQMFLWYFVVPELLPADWGRWVKRDMPYPQFLTAVVVPRALHGLARRRAGALGHRGDPARPAQCRTRHGPHAAAGLPLRADPRGLPHHHPAADQRLPGRVQEFLAGADDRRARTHLAGAPDRGVHLCGLRGLHGCHRALLPRHRPRDPDHAHRREAARASPAPSRSERSRCSAASISPSFGPTRRSCGTACC